MKPKLTDNGLWLVEFRDGEKPKAAFWFKTEAAAHKACSYSPSKALGLLYSEGKPDILDHLGQKVWHKKTGLTGLLFRGETGLEIKLDPPLPVEEFRAANLSTGWADHMVSIARRQDDVVLGFPVIEEDIKSEQERLELVAELEWLDYSHGPCL